MELSKMTVKFLFICKLKSLIEVGICSLKVC
jgi:hypothetical protein